MNDSQPFAERVAEFLNWMVTTTAYFARVLPWVLLLVLGVSLPADGLFAWFMPGPEDPPARQAMAYAHQAWDVLYLGLVMAVLLSALRGVMGQQGEGLKRVATLAVLVVVALALRMASSFSDVAATLLVLPMAVLALQCALMPCIVMLEGLGPADAFKESWRRMNGLRWRVFTLYVVLGVVYALWLAPSLGSVLVGGGRMSMVLIAALGKGLLSCFLTTALFVLYTDEGR